MNCNVTLFHKTQNITEDSHFTLTIKISQTVLMMYLFHDIKPQC